MATNKSYCLPLKFVSAFKNALKNRDLDPTVLRNLSSSERREAFSKVLGVDNAKDVNALFEQKMLLKDQQKAMISWAKQVTGISDVARKDIVDQIQSLDKILQPETEQAFLEDLTAKKLGAAVTSQEAQEVFDLSKKASELKTILQENSGDRSSQIAYGNALLDLSDRVDELKSSKFDSKSLSDWKDLGVNVANAPKTFLSSIDMSAPFNQGWGMVSTGRFWQGFAQMFRYFSSEKAYRDLRAYIVSHPDFDLAKQAKLGITEVGDKLTKREDAFQSSLIDRWSQAAADWAKEKTGFPVPNPFRASARAYTGFLNYLRFNRFVDLINSARLAGEDVSYGSEAAHQIAKVVNDFTGRGAIGKGDSKANLAPYLNTVFFAPRKLSATMNMFSPQEYLLKSPTARKAALRQLIGSLAFTGSVLGLAKVAGANINFDPRSTDFLKFEFGDEKFDVTGGNAIYSRLIARLITGQVTNSIDKVTTLGEGYKATTRADLIIRFLRNKLAPDAAILADALYGSNYLGQPFDMKQEMSNIMVPMTIGSFIDLAKHGDGDTRATVASLSTIFGVNMQTPMIYSQEGLNAWGDDAGQTNDPLTDKLNDEMDNLGLIPRIPTKTINGVKLNDKQHQEYIQISGKFAKAQLGQIIQQPGWESVPQIQKQRLVKAIFEAGKKNAQDYLINNDKDLYQKSIEHFQSLISNGK